MTETVERMPRPPASYLRGLLHRSRAFWTSAAVAGLALGVLVELFSTVALVVLSISTALGTALVVERRLRARRTPLPAPGAAGAGTGGENASIDDAASEILLWLQRRIGGELREAVERVLPAVLARVREQLPAGGGLRTGQRDAFLAERSIQTLQRKLGGEVRLAVKQALTDERPTQPEHGTEPVPVTIQLLSAPAETVLTAPAVSGAVEPEVVEPQAAEPGAEDLTAYRMNLHLQAIHDADGALVGVDTLLRWRHPTHGLVMPAEMLPRFARAGQLQSLLSSQLVTTVRIWKRLETFCPGLHVVVRADLTASADDDRLTCLRTLLTMAGIDPVRLQWDVSAAQALAMPTQFRDWEERCRRHGFSVLVSGWPAEATLTRATRMRVDGVRIDARDGAFRRLRAAEIAAGRLAGLTVTATGLEDVNAVAHARAAGVDLLLGYELGCPVPAAEFLDSLARRDAAPDRLAATATDPYPATAQLTEEIHDVPR